ncbi:hypothetical protein Y032_0811g2465 [Ancylostoma ceylanicum]|uniref:Carbonic anhydrase n=2 Tax=Ancylostoma ceylanicum TaxID=53326 RepID=A0A016WD80_9BILA|nr:hypothetical protein Y032_0811g2465 [Ancylostoma ceylanicum]
MLLFQRTMAARNCLQWIQVLLFISLSVQLISAEHWNYNDTHWSELCEHGLRQSPINLDIAKAVITNHSPLEFHHYDAKGRVTAVNNGHTELVQGFQSWTEQPYISGGGLKGRYYLQQFHFHWGDVDSTGSEHTLHLLHYPMEIHFVHILEGHNETSVHNGTGVIAVVSVMLQVADEDDVLANLEDAIIATNTSDNVVVKYEYSPAGLLPKDTATFFRYEGSLTTPPCTEGVIWTILAEPRYVRNELNFLREHATEEGDHLRHNWRPTQPLNNRVIYLNRYGYLNEDHPKARNLTDGVSDEISQPAGCSGGSISIDLYRDNQELRHTSST